MKKLFRIVTSRLFVVVFLILVQMVFWFLLLFFLGTYSIYIQVGLILISIAAVLYILNKNDNPVYKLAWIIPIMLVPVLGGLLYLIIGNKHPTRGMRRRLQTSAELVKPFIRPDTGSRDRLAGTDPLILGQIRYLEGQGFPVWDRTEADYYDDIETLFPVLLQSLREAVSFIFIEFFIIAEGTMWDEVLAILSEKAAQGVDVRVIYDDVGSISRLPIRYYRQLEKRGIRCMAFNPFIPLFSVAMNNRDHRKILIIDGNVGFTGGFNLGDEYINRLRRFGFWKDNALMLKGPAVRNMTGLFLTLWNGFYKEKDTDLQPFFPDVTLTSKAFGHCTGWVLPYGDSPLDDEPLAENAYLNIIGQACRYLYISTPYLLIDNEMTTALSLAAKRGVDVRIAVPGIPDKKNIYELTRSYYAPLMQNGVRIFEYTPGFLHAKTFLCDDRMAVIGSINLDYRSLYLHFECGVLLADVPEISKIRDDFDRIFSESLEVTPKKRRLVRLHSLRLAIMRLFSPML